MRQIFLLVIALLTQLVAWSQHEHHMPPAKPQSAPAPQKAPSPPKQNPAPVKRSQAPTKTTPTEDVIYTCPMHPEVQSTKPGNCPKCGMRLEKRTKPSGGKAVNARSEYNVVSDTPATVSAPLTVEMSEYVGETVHTATGKIVRYDLYVTDTMVNFTGKRKHGYAINGMIPAPTLVFTEGDTAEIYLHNKLTREEASLHWHGVILPNHADGVPLLTTAPIHPGESHLYRFPVVQNGTYWYHSHSGLQEQAGMYGALVFKKRETLATSEHEQVLVLSEWTDERPTQVQRRLRTANDRYAIKKGSTQSYSEAIQHGHFKTKVVNEWKRMKAMDVSDVYYNKFLTNGQPEVQVPDMHAGDKVKVRVVNAGASTYFWMQYAGGKITVVGNDGNDMEPVEVDRLIIAPAETYDLLLTVPENMSYELRATPEDRTGATSMWIGEGMKMPAPVLSRLKYFAGMKMMNDMMRTNGTMKKMDMEMRNRVMDMNTVMYPEVTGYEGKGTQSQSMQTHNHGAAHSDSAAAMNGGDITSLSYEMLRSPVKSTLPDAPTKTLHFNLTGNMNRYVWTIDNKTVKEADRIFIKKGENVRLILTNNSMMRHPMHLHGHDFRVLNSQGEYSPLKNVIDIMPMETDTIEFAGNQDGNWFFHCHILFHMMAGMGRVFRYENSSINPELPDAEMAYHHFRRHHDQNMKHLMIRAGIESNGSDGEAMVSNDRYALQEIWHLGWTLAHGYESETNIGRYFGTNQWLFGYVGFDYHRKIMDPVLENGHGLISRNIFGDESTNMFGQTSNKLNRNTIVAGVQYTLPLLFVADFRVDGNGKFRFQLGREDVPITTHLRFNLMANTDKEYMVGFRYVVNKWLAASTHYDSDMGLGMGITLIY